MSQGDTLKDSFETNAKLCRSVALNPAIYDRNNANFRKKSALNSSWLSVAAECGDTGRDDEATTSTSRGPRGKNAQYYRDYRARKRAEQEKDSLNRTSDVAGSVTLKKRKSAAEYQRECRARKKAKRDNILIAGLSTSSDIGFAKPTRRKTNAEYQREYRERKRVENCKRRWRQIRHEYSRTFNDSTKRRKLTVKEKNLYQSGVLKFLTPHIQPNDIDLDDEEIDYEDEIDSRSEVSTTPKLTASSATPKQTKNEKDTRKKRGRPEIIGSSANIIIDLDEERKSSEKDMQEEIQAQEADINANERTKDQSSAQPAVTEQSEEPETSEVGKKSPKFFIKQSSNETGLLIISKKTRLNDPLAAADNEMEQDLCDDDAPLATRSSRGRRVSKRSLDKQRHVSPVQHAVKELPVQKTIQRTTRMTRRQSMSAIGLAMQGSPIKLSPVPKPKSKESPTTTPVKTGIMRTTSTRVSFSSVGTQPKTTVSNPSILKPVKTNTSKVSISETAKMPIDDHTSIEGETGQAGAMRISPSASTKVTHNSVFGQPAPVAVKVISQTKSTVNQAIQCGSTGCYADDEFLNVIRPQMAEMNPRQKLNFRRKVFQSLMEVFDDATDFPGAGEVQHFNINTPSGFENVSDEELRLVRELVSMVSAAKFTPETRRASQSKALTTGRSNSPNINESLLKAKPFVQQSKDELGLPRTVIHRLIKSAEANGESASLSTMNGDKRCIYRIVPKGLNGKLGVVGNTLRTSAIDGSPNGRSGTIIIQSNTRSSPNNSLAKTVAGNANSGMVMQRTISENSPANKTISSIPSQVRVVTSRSNTVNATQAITSTIAGEATARAMGRRYSVCGPIPQLHGNINSSDPGMSKSNSNLTSATINSSGSNPAVANSGVQLAVKRRMPVNATTLSAQRARYPHGAGATVMAKTTVQKNNATAALKISGVASNISGNIYTEFFTPPAPPPRPSNGSQVHGAQHSQISPFKRIQTSLRPAATKVPSPATNAAKNGETSLSRLFNDNSSAERSMETAATFAADDFSNIRIKQEQEDILGI